MHYFKDKFGRAIRLTDERLQHIETDHPELLKPKDKIEETLLFPSSVIKSLDDEYTWLYYRQAEIEKQKSFLLVIVKISNGEGFVITAFYVKNMQKGDIVWKT
ncbi:MAG: hypothetical protein J4400_02065 [Candidatus Aenigmarchaeota archaeon]|nr:hypothetical protein [Candidatus Aenigmarchaeota archaeon]